MLVFLVELGEIIFAEQTMTIILLNDIIKTQNN